MRMCQRGHEGLALADDRAAQSVGWATMIDFNEVLAANSHRFREVLAGVPATPGCPPALTGPPTTCSGT